MPSSALFQLLRSLSQCNHFRMYTAQTIPVVPTSPVILLIYTYFVELLLITDHTVGVVDISLRRSVHVPECFCLLCCHRRCWKAPRLEKGVWVQRSGNEISPCPVQKVSEFSERKSDCLSRGQLSFKWEDEWGWRMTVLKLSTLWKLQSACLHYFKLFLIQLNKLQLFYFWDICIS